MIGTESMGTFEEALSRARALAQTDEPTADMLTGSAAEAVEPAPSPLGPSEELSGGAGAMYLREIANHELLTAQDEVELAQRLEAGKAALRELATADDTLAQARPIELEQQAEDGEKARRRLI